LILHQQKSTTMKISIRSAILALSVAESALAHSGLSNFYVNGKNQGDSVCIRQHLNPSTWNAPIEDLTSSDMACGRDGTTGGARVCPVQDGDTITFEYRQEAQKPNDVVFDQRHVGPCTVYAKKVDSAINDKATGDGWFKLWHEGYDEKEQKWCTDKLIAAGGHMSVVLPKGLLGGYYLLRSEFLALQNAKDGDPQYYIGCAQVFLESSGNLGPQKTVSMPGLVEKTDPSDSFNVYDSPLKLPYPIPGPDVATLVPSSAKGQTTQTEGVKPANCVDESGNWCGLEVADYSTKEACQASTADCWAQSKVCFAQVPATGNAGCNAWQSKCQTMQDDCNGAAMGPKDKGKDITPPKPDLSPVPPPLDGGTSAVGGTGAASGSTPSTPKGNSTVAAASAVPSSAATKAPADLYASASAAAAAASAVASVKVKAPVSEYIPPLASASAAPVYTPVSEYIPPLAVASAAPAVAGDSTTITTITSYRTATVYSGSSPTGVAVAAGAEGAARPSGAARASGSAHGSGSCGGSGKPVGRHRRVKHQRKY
jgi:hypothetical protein